MSKSKDLTGQVFGRLTVLHRTTQEEHPHKVGAGYHVIWTCQCECGKIIFVQGSSLRNGKAISCGCYGKEVASRLARKLGNMNRANLVGQRFGRLTVQKIYKTGPENDKGFTEWECICDCGMTTHVRTNYLLSGHTTSCGCARNNYLSPGAKHIINILNQENIPFVLEKTFDDLHNGSYRFDFYITNIDGKVALIEYDSIIHFEQVKHFHKTKQDFQAAQERDRIKNSYALSHKIPLYRIPFWEIDNIYKSEDIFQDKFLVTNKWHNDRAYRQYLSEGHHKCGI